MSIARTLETDAQPQFTLRFTDLLTRIVFHGYAYLTRWSFDEKLSMAPYWRLYCNREAGGVVRYDGKRFDLDPGSIYLIPPDTGFCVELEQPFHHFHIHFIIENTMVHVTPGIFRCVMDKSRKAMINRIGALSSENLLDGPEGGCAMLGLIFNALGGLPRDAWRRHELDHRVMQAVGMMESSDSPQSVGNGELARAVNMSENAFIRLFSQQMKMSPMRYYVKRRLARASSMLMHGDRSIDQVADLCGFCDRAHFSKSFKKVYGLNPAEYCRKMRPF